MQDCKQNYSNSEKDGSLTISNNLKKKVKQTFKAGEFPK